MYKISKHRKHPWRLLLMFRGIAYLFEKIKYFSFTYFLILLLQRNIFSTPITSQSSATKLRYSRSSAFYTQPKLATLDQTKVFFPSRLCRWIRGRKTFLKVKTEHNNDFSVKKKRTGRIKQYNYWLIQSRVWKKCIKIYRKPHNKKLQQQKQPNASLGCNFRESCVQWLWVVYNFGCTTLYQR